MTSLILLTSAVFLFWLGHGYAIHRITHGHIEAWVDDKGKSRWTQRAWFWKLALETAVAWLRKGLERVLEWWRK